MEINIKNDFDIKLISTSKLINEVENLHTIDNSAKMLINTLLEQIIKRDNLNK
jgi:hypothetical protein